MGTVSKFSKPVQEWLDKNGYNLDSMNLEELEDFKNTVQEQIDKDVLFDLSIKLLGNGAYGASSHPAFYFYNIALASDITAECRETTRFMEVQFENFFHNEWWERTDIHKQFGIELDQSKKDWYANKNFCIYGDTDSLYCCYGDLFRTFVPETIPKTDKDKLDWILRFNKEFLDKWNNERLSERFNSRHGQNIHEFELETVAKSGIFLAKKKYTQALVFSKGNYYIDKPKVKGKGVELIKPSTPNLARKILTSLVNILLSRYTPESPNQFALLLSKEIKKYKEQWDLAPVEDISMSGNINRYSDSVFDDKKTYDVSTHAGLPTKGIALFNYMCNKKGLANMCIYSGKIKYYYTNVNKTKSDVFAFQSGELPDWAPQPARTHQFLKTVIDPLNRFCSALKMPLMDPNGNFQHMLLF